MLGASLPVCAGVTLNVFGPRLPSLLIGCGV
jgi:hypothetical protein